MSQVQEWGVRDLAYLVAKQRRAFYVLFEYRATPKALQEIERNLTPDGPGLAIHLGPSGGERAARRRCARSGVRSGTKPRSRKRAARTSMLMGNGEMT